MKKTRYGSDKGESSPAKYHYAGWPGISKNQLSIGRKCGEKSTGIIRYPPDGGI